MDGKIKNLLWGFLFLESVMLRYGYVILKIYFSFCNLDHLLFCIRRLAEEDGSG